MIVQDESHITHYVRHGDFWNIRDYREMSAEIELTSIDVKITLEEIYSGVIFEL